MSGLLCLWDIKPGQRARVAQLNAKGSMRRRLLDIGLVNGTLVESLPVKTADGVSRRTLMVCARQVWESFLMMLCRNSEAEMPFLS